MSLVASVVSKVRVSYSVNLRLTAGQSCCFVENGTDDAFVGAACSSGAVSHACVSSISPKISIIVRSVC